MPDTNGYDPNRLDRMERMMDYIIQNRPHFDHARFDEDHRRFVERHRKFQEEQEMLLTSLEEFHRSLDSGNSGST